jgi:hypothetical protein
MSEAYECWGGPEDGREVRVPPGTPALRFPVVEGWVARYARVDHADGRISFRYVGQDRPA